MGSSPRLMIADDDAQIRDLLSTVFRERGFEIDTAEHGAQARQFLASRRYDLVIMDVQMPQFNGFEVLNELRRSKITTPVVMVSGNVTVASQSVLRDLGPVTLLPKPFEISVLLDRVQQVQNSPAPSQGPPLRVLIADDHEPTRSMLLEFLVASGFTTTAVADGDRALSAAATASPPFDVAILDVVMPGIAGHELVKQLRQVSAETVPMIITGEATQDQIRRGYEDGAVTLLRKPLDLQVLLRVLNSVREESAARHRMAAETRAAAAVPAYRKVWRKAGTWFRAPRGTREHRQMMTAVIVAVAVLVGLVLTRVYLLVEDEAGKAGQFVDKMEDHAKKVEEYLEWDKRHKEELSGKRRPPDGANPK